MKLYCLFDKKSGEYSCLSAEKNLAMFERSLSQQINNPRSTNLLFTNAVDFDIYCVGEFDPQTATIVPGVSFVRNCNELKEVE